VLAAGEVVVGEGMGRIQIENTHKSIQAWNGITVFQIATSSSLLAIGSNQPDPLPSQSMEYVRSNESDPKLVSPIPIVSSGQGMENWGIRKSDEQHSKGGEQTGRGMIEFREFRFGLHFT
jgi:hypothetical protein